MSDAKEISRRKLLNQISIAGVGMATVVVSVPIVAYLLSPFIKGEKRVWQDVGAVSDFEINKTVQVNLQDPSPLPWAGETALTSAWLRRGTSGFIAFSVHCTHLGCPVNWNQGGQLFLCPCHGGVFTANGDPAGGPPQRPLQRHHVRVNGDRVEIKPVPLRVKVV
ncbi:MAG TPA: ubiquinol-cytochrome c reductase iron-sulfur subunit [Thermomicrobiales bacterium]|nr:ubiquinol-cytochrome c reductase iron-sulfur subunit [Thermomicrobiales bacterium]